MSAEANVSTGKRSLYSLIALRNAIEHHPQVHAALQRIGRFAHPNHITAVRLPGALAALALDTVSPVAATLTWSINTLLDWLDGAVARSTDGLETREGTLLDTCFDKLSNASVLLPQICQHMDSTHFAIAALVDISLNVISQLQRGPLARQAEEMTRGLLSPSACEAAPSGSAIAMIKANTAGKIKQILECLSIGCMLAAGDVEVVRMTATGGLIAASICSVASTTGRWFASRKKAAAG